MSAKEERPAWFPIEPSGPPAALLTVHVHEREYAPVLSHESRRHASQGNPFPGFSLPTRTPSVRVAGFASLNGGA